MTSLDLDLETFLDLKECTQVHRDGTTLIFVWPYAKLFVNGASYRYESHFRDLSGTLSTIDLSRCKLFAETYLKHGARG